MRDPFFLEDLNALFALEAQARHQLLACRSPQMRRSLVRRLTELTGRIASFRSLRAATPFPALLVPVAPA